MTTIKFAILGCGIISVSHAEGIRSTPGAELTAVCDIHEASAKKFGESYSVPYFTDYELLLARKDIDVVCICTPSGMHAEQTVQAARAGKHVICEKPLAIRPDDAERMIRACREQGVKLASVLPRRMTPAARYVKRLIEEDRLGKLSLCSGYARFYRDQAYYDSAGWRGTWEMDGGGAMMNQGIHTIDLLQWLVGPVAKLTGHAYTVLRNIEVEDTAVAVLTYRNGALGVLEITTTAYKQPDHQIIIHGDKGTVILTGDEITSLAFVSEPVEIPSFPAVSSREGHRLQIEDMVHAIRDNREPIVSGEDARSGLALIWGTYESSRLKQEIRIV
ncbi:MAG: Gfo/Idh/MocA family oxidoreductase [Paenibacillaceae bacterium]|nr:Gfo/Idh/MocA family oxidoreductase [Paenibacillaceae bacterium]